MLYTCARAHTHTHTGQQGALGGGNDFVDLLDTLEKQVDDEVGWCVLGPKARVRVTAENCMCASLSCRLLTQTHNLTHTHTHTHNLTRSNGTKSASGRRSTPPALVCVCVCVCVCVVCVFMCVCLRARVRVYVRVCQEEGV